MPADTIRPGRHVVWLKRGLLLFWAAYLTLVFTTNLCDGLKAAGMLPAGWAFASGNYAFLCETTARYGTPAWANAVLFGGVVCWEGLAATLFWLAGIRFRQGGKLVYAASGCGLGLWAAFVLADEVFVAYAVETTHWRLFAAQLATLLAVELLPEGEQGRRAPYPDEVQ
jgi:hypothetical protein